MLATLEKRSLMWPMPIGPTSETTPTAEDQVRSDVSEEKEAPRATAFKEAVDERARWQQGRLITGYELGAQEGLASLDDP
jgi:hypothetical protein